MSLDAMQESVQRRASPRLRSGPGAWTLSRWPAESPTRTSRSRIADAATSCGSGDDILVHGVVRANELAASRAAHLAGLGPRVVHAEPGILVLDFVEGRTFTPEDVRNPANLERLVDMVRRCHRDIPQHLRGPAAMFWVFHVVRDYAHTLREGNSRHARHPPGSSRRADATRSRRRSDRGRLRPQRPACGQLYR